MKFNWIITSIMLLSIFLSCKPQKYEVGFNIKNHYLESKVINDIFLQSIDTPYYPYDDFLLHDIQTLKLKNESNLIAVSDKLKPIFNFDFRYTLTSKDFNQPGTTHKKDEYSFLESDTAIHILNLDSLTNIGRFKVIRNYDFSKKVNQGVLGSIQFSRIAFDQQFTKGYLVITTKDKVKSSAERLVFVELVNGKWRIRKSIILSVS